MCGVSNSRLPERVAYITDLRRLRMFQHLPPETAPGSRGRHRIQACTLEGFRFTLYSVAGFRPLQRTEQLSGQEPWARGMRKPVRDPQKPRKGNCLGPCSTHAQKKHSKRMDLEALCDARYSSSFFSVVC